MKKFFTEVFQDETGSFSSKRFVGVIAGLTLCISLYVDSACSADFNPSDSLVNAVAMLSFGCLGLASVDKIWAKRPPTPEAEVPKTTEEVVKEE